jgi:hypothetical protein
MRKFFSSIPFFSALIFLGALLYSSDNPKSFVIVVCLLGFVAIATSAILCFRALFSGGAVTPGAMPALLVAGASLVFFFVEEAAARAAIAVAASFLFFLLVRRLVDTANADAKEELRALFEWSGFVALFGIGAGLLASITFLNMDEYFAALIYAVVVGYVSFVLARLSGVKQKVYPLAAMLFLLEGFVIISFLPTSHWVGAGVLGAVAYLLFSLLNKAAPASVRRALISAGIASAVLLLTARWR